MFFTKHLTSHAPSHFALSRWNRPPAWLKPPADRLTYRSTTRSDINEVLDFVDGGARDDDHWAASGGRIDLFEKPMLTEMKLQASDNALRLEALDLHLTSFGGARDARRPRRPS